MQHPFAVEAEGGAALRHLAEPVHVADLQVRPVDGLQVVHAGRHQDAHEDVVVRVARVPGDQRADRERPHVDGRHEVRGAEDDRFQPGGRRGDRVDVHQPGGVLDLRPSG